MYDFHKKTSTDSKQHIFTHPLFQKGNEQFLAKIKRKKNIKRSSKSSLSPERSVTGKQRRARFLEEVKSLNESIELPKFMLQNWRSTSKTWLMTIRTFLTSVNSWLSISIM